MEQKKLTARQVEVLSAELQRKTIRTTAPLRNTLRSAGYLRRDATYLIARELGYRDWDLPLVIRQQIPEALAKDYGGLSAAGMEALRDHLRSGRVNDPTDNRLALIGQQLPVRKSLDELLVQWLADYRAREAAISDRLQVARNKAWVADTRLLLINAGLGPVMYELADDADVLELAKAIAGAEFSLRYFRFLDDADLSQMLDETQKDAQRPGTIGDLQRSEKIAAIREEFKRRAIQETLAQ